LALRTPEDDNSVVAAQKTHAMLVICGFQSGETSSTPGTCVPHAPESISAYTAFTPSLTKGSSCQHGTASEEPVSVTDEKPTLISVGLMGQVASSRPYPPSSHDEVTERPGWQPRGLPDLPNFR
jgi:hypothetical protein